MSARWSLSSPAPMTVVTTLTADNFRVPDELFFYGVMGLPPNPPSPYLRLCHSAQFPPSTLPPGSILLNRGIDGSMLKPKRATAAALSVRWLDIELEEEEETRRRERDARLAAEEEKARRGERDAMLSAGGGGGATEGVSSWAVHPEAAAMEGAPRRWESTRARLAREAREAAAAAEAAAPAAPAAEEEEEEGAAGGEEEEEQESASSAIQPEAMAV
ncbi:unnamed protein product [Ectocarpus sp. CCAP 1310/34]|nr:unnamed protein product [Ectocarpus sp. CCAP 1310/34]